MYKNTHKAIELIDINLDKNYAFFNDDILGKCILEFTELDNGALHPYMIVTSKNECIEYYETDIIFFNLFEVLHILTLNSIKLIK